MKKYGLIGKNLSYSYSKIIHEYLYSKFNIDATYELISVAELNYVDIDTYDGINITTPYKQEIIRHYLDRSDSVNIINAANVIHNNKAYNTDIDGFLELIERLNITISDINRVVILGDSQSAKMIKYVFKNSDVLICSRSQKPGVITYDQEDLLYGDLIINTTILGMGNYEDCSAVSVHILKNFSYAIDLNYNPMRSKFLLDAAQCGLENINGIRMLIVQAIRTFEMWNSMKVDKDIYDELYHHIVKTVSKTTIFVGMPYAGKNTLYNYFVNSNLNAVDLEQILISKYGLNENDYIKKHGLLKYNDLVSNILDNEISNSTKYIFCTSKIVCNLKNIKFLKSIDVVYIDTPLNILLKRLNLDLLKRHGINFEDDFIKIYNDFKINYEIYANRKLTFDEIVSLNWT